MEITELELDCFDDFHLHLRDGEALARTVADSSAWCERAVIMPNLTPAIDTIEAAKKYQERIAKHIPAGRNFQTLMTLYLSNAINIQTIKNAKQAGIFAIKWYPKGATTNSDQGISDDKKLYPIFEAMEKYQVPLLVHAETVELEVDIFDREAFFLDKVLCKIREQFPNLKITVEHITTQEGADFVRNYENTAATITPQHLLYNRNDLLVGGIKPHLYCLPILKSNQHRQALLQAATSGEKHFFLGTDSAPHAKSKKESSCGCAGCYSALHAPSLYAQAFDSVGKIDKLSDFGSKFAAEFYGLSIIKKRKIFLKKINNKIESTLDYCDEQLIPLAGSQIINWSFTTGGSQ